MCIYCVGQIFMPWALSLRLNAAITLDCHYWYKVRHILLMTYEEKTHLNVLITCIDSNIEQ